MPEPTTTPAPTISVVMGFDFGLKRIGIAIGQTITGTANPLTTLKTEQGHPPWRAIQTLIQEWRPQALVVGVPRNMDDTDAPITATVRVFIQQLKERFKLPIFEVDERLSTREARARQQDLGEYTLANRSALDRIAAQIILESWLREQH